MDIKTRYLTSGSNSLVGREPGCCHHGGQGQRHTRRKGEEDGTDVTQTTGRKQVIVTGYLVINVH